MERYVETPIHSVNLHTRLNWIINQARLAALDDCKTLLERELNHAKNKLASGIAWKSMNAWNERKETIEYLLAELETLRKKVMP